MTEVRDLLELLYGAARRWSTLQCSVRHWHHTARGQLATERWVAASSGSATRMYATDGGGPRPETSERRERLWIAKPDRSRVESEHSTTVVHGRLWWSFSPHMGYISNEHDPETGTSDPLQSYAALLDPVVLIPQIEIDLIQGRTVHVRPRAVELHAPGLPPGADRHVLTVDDRGVVVRLESMVEDGPFAVSELVDPAWDEVIPETTFTLQVPEGEEVRSPRDLHGFGLTLEEAASRAGFTVFAVGMLPDGVWRSSVHHHPARGETREQLTILYHRADGRGSIHAVQHSAADEHPWARPRDWAHVAIERDGTHVALQSGDYDEETLEGLLGTLVRV